MTLLNIYCQWTVVNILKACGELSTVVPVLIVLLSLSSPMRQTFSSFLEHSWPVGLFACSPSYLAFENTRLVRPVFVVLPPYFPLVWHYWMSRWHSCLVWPLDMCVFEILWDTCWESLCNYCSLTDVQKERKNRNVSAHHSTLLNLASSSKQSSWLSCLMGYLHQAQTVVIKYT